MHQSIQSLCRWYKVAGMHAVLSHGVELTAMPGVATDIGQRVRNVFNLEHIACGQKKVDFSARVGL